MKKAVLGLSALVLVAVVALVYHFSGKEFVFRFTEAQLQQKLDERMPWSRTFLVIFPVTLSRPLVHLAEGSNRVNAGMEFQIKLSNESKPIGGSVFVSGGLRYDTAKGAFFLTDPKIEQSAVQGISEKYVNKANEVLTLALAAYFAQHPIYTLSVTDAKQAAGRAALKSVKVENRELVVTLGL